MKLYDVFGFLFTKRHWTDAKPRLNIERDAFYNRPLRYLIAAFCKVISALAGHG